MPSSPSLIPSDFVTFEHNTGHIGLNGPYYYKALEAGAFSYGFLTDERHSNPNGVIHGAALFSFVDTVFGHLIVTNTQRLCATVSLTSEFIAATKVGHWVHAEVYIKKLTRSMAFVGAEVFSGDNLLMSATGIFKLFSANARVPGAA